MTNLIVGLDPGTTVGIAVLGLDGGIKHVSSHRNIPTSEVIKIISGFGRPTVIACDKAQMPESVRKIASACDARAFSPDRDLLISKKRELAENCENGHERDALASAVYAYNHLQNKLRWVDTRIRESLDDIKADVIKGGILNLALSRIFADNSDRSDEVAALKKELQKLKRRAAAEHVTAVEAGGGKPVILDLAAEDTEEAKKLLGGLLNNSAVLLRTVDSLRYSDVVRARMSEGDVVYALSPKSDERGIRTVEGAKVRAIVVGREVDTALPQVRPTQINVGNLFGFYYADKGALLSEIKKAPLSAARIEKVIREYKGGR